VSTSHETDKKASGPQADNRHRNATRLLQSRGHIPADSWLPLLQHVFFPAVSLDRALQRATAREHAFYRKRSDITVTLKKHRQDTPIEDFGNGYKSDLDTWSQLKPVYSVSH
jgi:hypothetical protein